MKSPTLATIKRLFAKSNNKCSMPGCPLPLVSTEGTIIGEVCHIRADSPKGPRYDSKQSDEDRHGYGNLLLLCSMHHKTIDTETRKYPTNKLLLIKKQNELDGIIDISPQITKIAQSLFNKITIDTTNKVGNSKTINNQSTTNTVNFNKDITQAIIGNNNSVSQTINHITKKSQKPKYSPGTLGAATIKANYVSHLIARYNEYKEIELKETGEKLNYGFFGGKLKKEFKLGANRTIYHAPEEQFDSISSYIQKRINGTKFAKTKNGIRNYSTFQEYIEKIYQKT